MAKAYMDTIMVPEIKTILVEKRKVVLELSPEEADVLRRALGVLPITDPTDPIFWELDRARWQNG